MKLCVSRNKLDVSFGEREEKNPVQFPRSLQIFFHSKLVLSAKRVLLCGIPSPSTIFSMSIEVFLSTQLLSILHIPGALGRDQPGSGGHPPTLWEVADILRGWW